MPKKRAHQGKRRLPISASASFLLAQDHHHFHRLTNHVPKDKDTSNSIYNTHTNNNRTSSSTPTTMIYIYIGVTTTANNHDTTIANNNNNTTSSVTPPNYHNNNPPESAGLLFKKAFLSGGTRGALLLRLLQGLHLRKAGGGAMKGDGRSLTVCHNTSGNKKKQQPAALD